MKKKTIIKKSDIYPIEKVNERIEFYKKKLEQQLTPEQKLIHKKLLSFWETYKSNNYQNE